MGNTTPKPIPNITIWSWMRSVLKLVGSELLLFAYLFSETFDNSHKCFTGMSEMQDWFGITRQALSRNLNKLAEKGYIVKQCKQDPNNKIIKHNNYSVHIENVTRLCEESDETNYKNFLDSYKGILVQKFPNDLKTIDKYLQSLEEWHSNKDMEVRITLNEIARLISFSKEDIPMKEALEQVITQKPPKCSPKKEFIEPKPKQKKTSLIEPTKRKSKQTLRNEWDKIKRSMCHEFVFFRVHGTDELLNLLYDFLDTDNGRSYTPQQWEQQLENLYTHGRTLKRMIEGVRISYMNNYRSLYIVDKSEVDIDEKLQAIETYVKTEADDNAELKELLTRYVMEVPKGKSYTSNQFRLALRNLSSLCPTTEQKIQSVEISYTNSYAALAYPNSRTSTTVTEVDTEKKKQLIDEFIKKGYYFLIPELKRLLVLYITECNSGLSMTSSMFELCLKNLRLLCLNDQDKLTKIQLAIQNNSSKLATEDFDESRRIKAKHETRETMADSMDRNRHLSVIKEKQKNPNNPLLKDFNEDITLRDCI